MDPIKAKEFTYQVMVSFLSVLGSFGTLIIGFLAMQLEFGKKFSLVTSSSFLLASSAFLAKHVRDLQEISKLRDRPEERARLKETETHRHPSEAQITMKEDATAVEPPCTGARQADNADQHVLNVGPANGVSPMDVHPSTIQNRCIGARQSDLDTPDQDFSRPGTDEPGRPTALEDGLAGQFAEGGPWSEDQTATKRAVAPAERHRAFQRPLIDERVGVRQFSAVADGQRVEAPKHVLDGASHQVVSGHWSDDIAGAKQAPASAQSTTDTHQSEPDGPAQQLDYTSSDETGCKDARSSNNNLSHSIPVTQAAALLKDQTSQIQSDEKSLLRDPFQFRNLEQRGLALAPAPIIQHQHELVEDEQSQFRLHDDRFLKATVPPPRPRKRD